MPRVYLIPSDTPNAFATGRNPEHAVVAVTEGIMRILDEEELEGVLAHELSHVQNRDVLICTIAATLAGAITYLAHMAQWAAIFGGGRRDDDEEGGERASWMILMAVLAPLAAMLVQLAVSRSREFQADASGRPHGRAPWGLAKALEKLEMAVAAWRRCRPPRLPRTLHRQPADRRRRSRRCSPRIRPSRSASRDCAPCGPCVPGPAAARASLRAALAVSSRSRLICPRSRATVFP